jgi:DNA-binding winged helix-turn-helix (wHTH) protein
VAPRSANCVESYGSNFEECTACAEKPRMSLGPHEEGSLMADANLPKWTRRSRLRGRRRHAIQPQRLLFDPERQCIERNGVDVPLTAIEARLVARLLRRPGTVVSIEDLLRSGWLGEPRGPEDLYKQVHSLRLVLERSPHRPTHLITRRGLGYMLIGVATVLNRDAPVEDK